MVEHVLGDDCMRNFNLIAFPLAIVQGIELRADLHLGDTFRPGTRRAQTEQAGVGKAVQNISALGQTCGGFLVLHLVQEKPCFCAGFEIGQQNGAAFIERKIVRWRFAPKYADPFFQSFEPTHRAVRTLVNAGRLQDFPERLDNRLTPGLEAERKKLYDNKRTIDIRDQARQAVRFAMHQAIDDWQNPIVTVKSFPKFIGFGDSSAPEACIHGHVAAPRQVSHRDLAAGIEVPRAKRLAAGINHANDAAVLESFGRGGRDLVIVDPRVTQPVGSLGFQFDCRKFNAGYCHAAIVPDGTASAENRKSEMMQDGVWTGIDILIRENFAPLLGSRMGLVTNHTGLTREGRATIDMLQEAPGVSLSALFGPEHGIRGAWDEPVADAVDTQTGLPVYSLFGARNQPTAEQLAGLDTLVFDIQDIGCRFYTYISTLGNVLEAASAQDLRVVVLDRPNPINGLAVEGPLADPENLSFVAYHPIPIRHGLTVGEIARLIHQEKGLKGPLEVIRCEDWQRKDWYDATGLLWTNPSPNMRRLTAATLYPGIGLLEMTNVSVGRGTDTPFEVFGAPYIDVRAFAAALNDTALPGIRFLPVRFTPTASVFVSEECGGVQCVVTDREEFNSVQVGLTLAIILRRLYPNDWQPEKLQKLLVHPQTQTALMAGADYETLAGDWAGELTEFSRRTQPHLLY